MNEPAPSPADARTSGTRPVHMPGLDGVRGIAILLVMMLHFVGHPPSNSFLDQLVARVAFYGVYGVDLFFVLSGFLITGILHDAKTKDHYYRNFYARRTLRIFPLYYAVLFVLFFVLPLVLGSHYPDKLRVSQAHQGYLWTYLANVYVAQEGKWGALPFVDHFWSLAVEEHFYLVWPLIVKVLSPRATMRLCVVTILVSPLLRLALLASGSTVLAPYVLTPCRLDCLCMGGLLALVLKTSPLADRVRAACRSPWVFGLGVLCVVPITRFVAGTPLTVISEIRSTVLALFFGAVVVAAGSSSRSTLGGRFFAGSTLAFFGKLSYGLYVYHGILSEWLLELKLAPMLEGMLGNRTLAIAVYATLGTALSVGVALASYELFEKRVLKLKDRFVA